MVNLDYFYGSEGEQYRFYQIPAVLLEDDEYKKISDTAKILYGILLSRLAMSKKNNWIEEDTNRVYILYNRNDIGRRKNCKGGYIGGLFQTRLFRASGYQETDKERE